jgi:anti-anti-sigma factor
MEVKRSLDGDVHIVSLHGRFDAAAAPEAEAAFKDLINENPSGVVVDLEDVEYISSGGLRVIIMLAKALEKNDGALRLCALSPFVHEVFELTNLGKRYKICDTRGAALASIQSNGV